MKIYLLFTCDCWKSRDSRVLRGVFIDLNKLEDAKYTLVKNKVVNIPVFEDDEFFDVVETEENYFADDGGYL